VEFAGQVADIRAFWSQHDALVLASLAEGTPLAMVEAMLLGRACLATDVGGCGEWIRDGVDGVLAPGRAKDQPGHDHLIEPLLRLIQEGTAGLARLGASAAERARALQDLDPAGTLLAACLGQ
jgi:L-malate glycosyltransferase